MDDGAQVTVGGIITNATRKFTKKGDAMAVFMLEDLDAAVEVTVFPRTLVDIGHQIVDDRIVAVKARLDRRDEGRIGLMAQNITVLTGLDDGPAPLVRLRFPGGIPERSSLERLKSIIVDHPGESPVEIEMDRGRVLRLGDTFRVDTDRAVGELRVAFGHDAVLL